jgi:hypothetical protein
VKRKTFYYISLSLPYLVLILGGALLFLATALGIDWSMLGGLPGFFFGIVASFSVSAIIWGPLYTWMAVVMLFWGRGKNANEVRNMYLFLPVVLGCAMGIPAAFVDLRSSAALLAFGVLRVFNLDSIAPTLFKNYSFEESLVTSLAWALMAAVCLIVGYIFVGMVLLIEKVMKRRSLCLTEEESRT